MVVQLVVSRIFPENIAAAGETVRDSLCKGIGAS
jgi:hypothetical protein